MSRSASILGAVARMALAQARRPRRRGGGGRVIDPRNAVGVFLAAVLLLGGGRKWLQGRRARAAAARLAGPGVTPEQVAEAPRHGREVLPELFQLLTEAPSAALRDAAGHALTVLWAQDHLVAEEEKAVVLRGFAADWLARRRYPRALRGPIPVAVTFGVRFLRPEGAGIRPEALEWSYRILGTQRASLEGFSPWAPGPGRADFSLDPADFPSPGPHRLVLQARARPRGLTSSWELDLPHLPFSFEFDPLLAVEALLTQPDESRGEAMARAVRLEPADASAGIERSLDLGGEWVLGNPPSLVVATPLPCDLAHAVAVELEGVPEPLPAGAVVLGGQGDVPGASAATRTFALGPIAGLPPGAIDRPGERRLRAILTADPDRGWADPSIRSLWPGRIVTDWIPVRVLRR